MDRYENSELGGLSRTKRNQDIYNSTNMSELSRIKTNTNVSVISDAPKEINIEKINSEIKINMDEDNLDGLNYLSGKTLDFVNKKAMEGTIAAHVEGDVPNILINMEELNEETIGYLIYFFELACAMSGNLLGVDPFNQPGVEKYKTNMFKLLKKPGYEEN